MRFNYFFFFYILFNFLKPSNFHLIKLFFLSFVIVHINPVFILFFIPYMYVKTLNILVVFFSPSFIYVSHHHFDECFTENTGYVTSNLNLYNQPQSPNMQKKSRFHGNGVVDTTVLFEGWSTEFGFTRNAILIFQTLMRYC